MSAPQHRAWMEFGSAILSDLWGLETTSDAAIFESKRQAISREVRACRRRRWAQARSSPATSFSLVDAVFAPIFRYFDCVRSSSTDLARLRPRRRKVRGMAGGSSRSEPRVQAAVGPDYPELLRAFLVRHDAHLLKLRGDRLSMSTVALPGDASSRRPARRELGHLDKYAAGVHASRLEHRPARVAFGGLRRSCLGRSAAAGAGRSRARLCGAATRRLRLPSSATH